MSNCSWTWSRPRCCPLPILSCRPRTTRCCPWLWSCRQCPAWKHSWTRGLPRPGCPACCLSFPPSGRWSPGACRRPRMRRCCRACPIHRSRCRPMKMSRQMISCPSPSHLLLNLTGPKTFTIHTSLRSGTAAAKTFARCNRTTPPDLVNTVLMPDPAGHFRSAPAPPERASSPTGAPPPAPKGRRRADFDNYWLGPRPSARH